MIIDVLHGPNLNLLGAREPQIYGSTTLAAIDASLRELGDALGFEVNCRQSNHEGQLIDWIQDAFARHVDGLVINPGGYAHTSVALRDAIAVLRCPVIEVHLSNVFAREPFRHTSLVSPVATGVVSGLGAEGYRLAIRAIAQQVRAHGG